MKDIETSRVYQPDIPCLFEQAVYNAWYPLSVWTSRVYQPDTLCLFEQAVYVWKLKLFAGRKYLGIGKQFPYLTKDNMAKAS